MHDELVREPRDELHEEKRCYENQDDQIVLSSLFNAVL